MDFIDNMELVGLRMDPDDDLPTFYTILIGEDWFPIQTDHQFILFGHRDLLPKAASLGGLSEKTNQLQSLELEVVYDLAAALYLIENSTVDDSAVIINCLNFFFDVVKLAKAQMPSTYRNKLTGFADHLTFSKSLNDYFSKTDVQRSEIIDGVLWCLGCLFSHARILH
jgi:hypothetical protein